MWNLFTFFFSFLLLKVCAWKILYRSIFCCCQSVNPLECIVWKCWRLIKYLSNCQFCEKAIASMRLAYCTFNSTTFFSEDKHPFFNAIEANCIKRHAYFADNNLTLRRSTQSRMSTMRGTAFVITQRQVLANSYCRCGAHSTQFKLLTE